MLDVHPPHHPTHGWRDFFVHIATIVVGLLIAIGLEQVVERIHEHYELRELRESLQREAEANRNDMQDNIRNWRWEMAELQNDLLVLRYLKQHPGTAQADLPGDLPLIQYPVLTESGVWDAAQRKGIVNLMPIEEANREATLYVFLKGLGDQGLEEWNAFNDADRYSVYDGNPTHMTAEQLDRTIQLVQITIEKHIQLGDSMAYLRRFPELGSTLTYDEVNRARHYPFRETPQEVAHAHQLTVDRLAAAGLPKEEIQRFLTAPDKKQP